ncbi:MAG: MFS transporter, partial [Muribaculaceae bacterium]|nr:MFS transporter [Muribaculaceae bacterium]
MAKTTTAQSAPARGNVVAIIAMFFLFAMISFVTNLAAPLGTIWQNNYDWSGMLGNMMNFLAYLFMGIPAGNLLTKIGYKKTALYAMLVGLAGLVLQWLSGIVGTTVEVFPVSGQMVTLNFIIYLLGAFICGFCVCMLNTVVNPMLNQLGGGGNTGNQLVQTGGT